MAFVLMLCQWPFFYHSAFGILYTIHNNKSVRVNFVNFGLKLGNFKPGDDRINYVGVFKVFALPAIAPFPIVNSNTPTKFFDYHQPNFFGPD